jgi:hypothetical protein
MFVPLKASSEIYLKYLLLVMSIGVPKNIASPLFLLDVRRFPTARTVIASLIHLE